MKGIKTEVKTDWKNLAHGNTRYYDFRNKKSRPFVSGFKVGDKLCASYTVRWRLADEGNKKGFHVQTSGSNEWPFVDFEQGKSNEDNVAQVKTTHRVAHEKQYEFYSPKLDLEQYGAKKDENSYVIIENIMVSKDNFLPYIDSDELKATGGGGNK